MVTLHGITHDNEKLLYAFSSAWEFIGPLVERDGKYTRESLLTDIRNRVSQLWVVIENSQVVAAGISEIHQVPQAKILFIKFFGAKSLDTALEVFPQFLTWGKENSCDTMEFYGKPAWRNKFPNAEEVSTLFRAKL